MVGFIMFFKNQFVVLIAFLTLRIIKEMTEEAVGMMVCCFNFVILRR